MLAAGLYQKAGENSQTPRHLFAIIAFPFPFATAMLPMQCTLCAATASRRALCDDCRADLELLRLHDPCHRCGLPQAAPLCSRCAQQPPAIDRTFVRYKYQPPLDALISQFKYGGQWQLAATLALLMPLPPPADMALALPLHPAREAARGFNQARELAKKIRLRPLEGVLVRRVNTAPQTELAARAARQKNMRDAFAADGAVHGKAVLLVDDVMTSGATLNEAARALKKAGAQTISALVLARALI